MTLKRLLAGFALVSIAEKALATATHSADNIATCDLTSVTHASSLSVSVAAKAVESVKMFLCEEEEGIPEKASAYALALADSFVNAVVETSASCYAQGFASFKVNGESVAYAQATAIAEAYVEAAAVAETCYKCHAATALVAHSYEKIFLEATTKIDTTLHGIASGANVSDSVSASAESFIKITVVALAKVLVQAHAEVDKCASTLQVAIMTGDKADANSITCTLNSTATDDEVVRNAIVAVATNTAAHVCGEGLANATFEIEAKAIGSAVAIAITQVTLDCQVDGLGTVCAMGKADITKTAEAVAYAFAFGYVSATSSCNTVCHNDVSVLTEAIASVLATATSHSLQSQCTGPDSYFDIDYIETQIVETSITALAKILTAATATSEGDCLIDLEIEAAVAPGQEQLVSGPPLDHRQPVAYGDSSKSHDSEHDDESEHPDKSHDKPEHPDKPYDEPEHPDTPHHKPEHPDKPYDEPEHPDKPHHKPGHPDKSYDEPEHPDKPHHKPEHPDKPHHKPEKPETVSKPHPKPDAHPHPARPASKPHYKSSHPAKPSSPSKNDAAAPARHPAPKRRTHTRPAKRAPPRKNHGKKVQRKKPQQRLRRRSSSPGPRRSRRRRSIRRVRRRRSASRSRQARSVRRSRRRRSADRSRRPRSARRSRRSRSGRMPSRAVGKSMKKAPASRRPSGPKSAGRQPKSGRRSNRKVPHAKRSRRVTMAVAAARARRERERRARDIKARREARAKRDARRGRDSRRGRNAL